MDATKFLDTTGGSPYLYLSMVKYELTNKVFQLQQDESNINVLITLIKYAFLDIAEMALW